MNTVRTPRCSVNAVVVGFALGVLVAVPAVVAAAASGGAGHGNYVAARALFPTPMLLTFFEGDRIGAFSVVIGLLQFPVYGTLLGWSIARKNWVPTVMVTLAHLVAGTVCFAAKLPNFS
jgi:hypothetical protein